MKGKPMMKEMPKGAHKMPGGKMMKDSEMGPMHKEMEYGKGKKGRK